MENKKSFLGFGLIALLLVLGVGYAVVSSVTISLSGSATASSQLNAEITNVQAESSITGKTVDFNHELGTKNLSDTFTINGIELNETVTVTYTIRNNETDVDAELSELSDLSNSNSTYFDVSYNITDSLTKINCEGDNTMTVVVSIKLKKTPVSEDDSSTTVGINFKAEATELRSCMQYS